MIFSVNDLRVYYQTLKGNVKAVDNISFTVDKGEIVGIAGESGSGKSTMGYSFIALKPPMKYISGEVYLDNKKLPIDNFNKMQTFRFRKISIIPQYALDAMNPIVKIGQMIKDLLACHNIRYNDRVDDLTKRLKKVNLSESVLNRYPFELSGGMKQRMVMVLSTLLNPSLLIADEITSALDVSTQKAVIEMLGEFRDDNIVGSILFITHDISVLYQIADTILIIYAGKVLEKASKENIIKKPLHPYTKLLISSLPDIGIRYTETKLAGIKGECPSLLDPPSGCRFKTRCPEVNEKCDEEPPFIKIAPNHYIACWRRIEENA